MFSGHIVAWTTFTADSVAGGWYLVTHSHNSTRDYAHVTKGSLVYRFTVGTDACA